MLEWEDRKKANAPKEDPATNDKFGQVKEEKETPVENKPEEIKPKKGTTTDVKPEDTKTNKPPTEHKPNPPKTKPTPAEPKVVDNDNIDNKGAIQQGGVGNINVAPGATVIIKTDQPVGGIGVNPPNNGFEQPITPPDPETGLPVDGKRKYLKNLTPEEIKFARDNGKNVANMLIGHTSNYDQAKIEKIIEKNINPDNVVEFLRGFEEVLKNEKKAEIFENGYSLLKGMAADHFFEQMLTEWDFPEKEGLMRKVAEDLQAHKEMKYGQYMSSEEANEIPVVLLEGHLGEDEAQKLDKFALKEIRREHYRH